MIYLAKGVHATTAIEGNTLTEEQVRALAEDRLQLPPSQQYLKQEVENVIGECNSLKEQVFEKRDLPLTRETIEAFNHSVLDRLDVDEDVIPGKIRRYSVGVARYRGAPAEDCAYLVDRLCEWMGGEVFDPPEGMRIVYAIIKAVLVHLYLAWIHPFVDGNGRTARLVEFQILITSGVPAPCAQLLSNHYNLTRDEVTLQPFAMLVSGNGGSCPVVR